MGTVSVAVRVQGGFTRYYAVKRLLPEVRSDPSQRAMFLEEARIAGSLDHPNVVPVLDVGEDAEGPFLVMEYVDGASVSALLQALRSARRVLPIEVALHIARDVGRGLQAAHGATDASDQPLGIIHRDVSPQNILVDFHGRVRLTDFGIARAAGRSEKTRTGVLKGKLGYMSPEQLRFQPVDQKSDLFALGVVLYELVSGTRLYPSGEDGMEGARRILEEPPPDLGEDRHDVPPELVRLVLDLLMKEPENRIESASAVVQVLDELLLDYPTPEILEQLKDIMGRLFGEIRSARSLRLSEGLKTLDQQSLSSSSASKLLIAAALTVSFVGGAWALHSRVARSAPNREVAERSEGSGVRTAPGSPGGGRTGTSLAAGGKDP